VGVRILVAEDNHTNAAVFRRALAQLDCEVTLAKDGAEALQALADNPYDILVTDWMMPQMDGIQLIEQMRATIDPAPYTLMVTAIDSAEAKERALDAGADDYMAKPINLLSFQRLISEAIERIADTGPVKLPPLRALPEQPLPDSVAVVIACSTGGPRSLPQALKQIPTSVPATFLVVQHAPEWALEAFTDRLDELIPMKAVLADPDVTPAVGTLYVARGDKHLSVSKNGRHLRIDDGPKENYVRPAADWMFRSAAAAFGEFCVAVILTGLGHDGTVGAAHIAAAGGPVIAEDPATANMPYMPQAALDVGVAKETAPLDGMSALIMKHVTELDRVLKRRKASAAS
jgi:two-component system, chemotaxis family, protein-glutamate methylesterase/glutaminase